MDKIKLPNVTLMAVSSVRIHETVKALEYSMQHIDYGEIKLLSHKKPFGLPKEICFEKIDVLNCINDFNYFMVYKAHKYVSTEFVLLIHYDGFVVNPKSWRKEFLDYDYIGAPWPIPDENDRISYRDEYGTLYRVGNSVSIRSKKLMELPETINLKWEPFHGWYNEDGFLCVNRRKELEQYGIKYAPVELAAQFSRENPTKEGEGMEPFCFHKWLGENSVYPNFTSFYYRMLNRILKA